MKTQKNNVRLVVVLSMLFVWSLLCHPRQSFADETETTLVSIFKFAGGVISAFMIHEGLISQPAKSPGPAWIGE